MVLKLFKTTGVGMPVAYGMREIKTVKDIEQILKEFDSNSCLFLSGDDPSLTIMASFKERRNYFYGIKAV